MLPVNAAFGELRLFGTRMAVNVHACGQISHPALHDVHRFVGTSRTRKRPLWGPTLVMTPVEVDSLAGTMEALR
ncbi:MAG: hypothetical protein CMJ89_15505 [Planctomycetes bacterium]|nr:hypothetical protein [Planctomycetota bacterium]